MHFALSTISVIALSMNLVAADFHIVASGFNDPVGSGTGTNIHFVNIDQMPNCDNLGSPHILSEDASGGGVACDGCRDDQPFNDWKITRFEMYDGNLGRQAVTKQQYGTLTAYLEPDGKYGLNAGRGDSERRIGHCDRVMGENLRCFQGLTTAFPTQIMTCFGESDPIDVRD